MPHLSILVRNRGTRYVCQCVEKDIAAQGATVDEMLTDLLITLQGQIEWDRELGIEPLSQTPAAPDCYRRIWQERAQGRSHPATLPPGPASPARDALADAEFADCL